MPTYYPVRNLRLLLSVGLLWSASAAAQSALLEIQVSGNQRFAPGAVIAASGLKVGQTAGPADFDAAIARIADTGLFTSVNYRYDPKTAGGKSGYALTLQIQEAPVARAVRLDFPGVDEQQLWQEIKSDNGLIDSQMPVSPESEAYYKRAIGAALQRLNHAQEIVVKNEVDFQTRKSATVFQGANLPKIAGIAFEGNRLIEDKDLQAALRKAAFFGEGYSENYIRLVLEQNIKPLYEERGRLTASFGKVSLMDASAGALVSVSIDERPEWTLGKVDLTGDAIPSEEMLKAAKFPEGRLANWKQIQASVGAAESILKHDGYLGPASQIARSYHDETHVVDLGVKVNKGQQSLFGAVTFKGLSPADEQQARKAWALKEGAPFNPFYISEYNNGYLRSVAQTLRFKSVSQQIRPRAGSNVVDVTIVIGF